MNKVIRNIFFASAFLFISSCATTGGNENTVFIMKTTLGDIKIMLYDDTPLHRDNFIKLINSGFYEGVSFHRIINNFMIQAGDPATRSVPVSAGADSLNEYTIPAEFNSQYFHKKGALAAAREGNNVNPEMRSSGTQFYIVHGVKLTDNDLALAEERVNSNIRQAMFNKYIRAVSDSVSSSGKSLSEAEVQDIASVKMFNYLASKPEYKMPENQRLMYKSNGGVPRLDGTYTVFGEVLEGLDVVDRIAAVKTDNADKPINDVKIIKIKIVSR